MYLNRVLIRSLRGFGGQKRALDLDLARPDGTYAGWTVIAGRNGSGKTTVLQALALALLGPSWVRSVKDDFKDWIHQGDDEGDVQVEVVPGKGDAMTGQGAAPKAPFWVGLEWTRSDDGDEPVIDTQVFRNAQGRRKVPERGPWSENPRGWFMAAYGSVRRLSGHSADAQRMMAGSPRVARVVNLFREDASLVEATQWLQDCYARSKDTHLGRPAQWAAEEMVERVLALLNHDDLLLDGVELRRVDTRGLWARQSATELRLTQLSDGYRTVITLVLDIVHQMERTFGEVEFAPDGSSVNNAGVVLIDEAELHLHVSWQKRLGFWLKRHFPNVQFLVTTHSPYICQAADPGGLIRLSALGDVSRSGQVSDETFRNVVFGSADDAVLSELFGVEHTHSDQAERLREELAALEVREMHGELSAPDRRLVLDLRKKLPMNPSAEVAQALRRLGSDP